MKPKEKIGTAEAMADASGTGATWMGNVLGRMGVKVDPKTGSFASSDIESVFEQAAQMLSQGGPRPLTSVAEKEQWATVAQMGVTQDDVREWTKKTLEVNGLRVAMRGGRDYSLFTLEREINGETFQLQMQTHVAMEARQQTGQAGFTVAGVRDEDAAHWHVFVVKTWGGCYLRSRKELEGALKKGRKKRDIVSITFSIGSTRDRFENRLPDLLKDRSWKKVTR